MSGLEVWWEMERRERGFGQREQCGKEKKKAWKGCLSMCKEKPQTGQYFWMVNVKANKAL